MSQPSEPLPPQPQAIQEQLRSSARLLREVRHLDPDAQVALAELLAELADRVPSASGSPAEIEHLAATSSHLADVLASQQEAGPLAATRHRLEELAARAESEAPVTAGVLRRLIDALSSIGI